MALSIKERLFGASTFVVGPAALDHRHHPDHQRDYDKGRQPGHQEFQAPQSHRGLPFLATLLFLRRLVTDLWYLWPEESIADEIVLLAEITSGEVMADGGVKLVGLTQGYNFDVRRNILFSACDHLGCNEPRTPFELIIGGSLGSTGMSVDWCEYPGPFSLKTKGGKVNINTGGQASSLQSAEFAQTEGAASGCRQ